MKLLPGVSVLLSAALIPASLARLKLPNRRGLMLPFLHSVASSTRYSKT